MPFVTGHFKSIQVQSHNTKNDFKVGATNTIFQGHCAPSRADFFKRKFSFEINDFELLFNLQKKLFEKQKMHRSYPKKCIFSILFWCLLSFKSYLECVNCRVLCNVLADYFRICGLTLQILFSFFSLNIFHARVQSIAMMACTCPKSIDSIGY